MIHGIDTTHWSFVSLFFDNVCDKSRRARDHEYLVECRRIHSQVGENRADRAALRSNPLDMRGVSHDERLGRIGKNSLTAVGNSHEDAKELYERAIAVLNEETRGV